MLYSITNGILEVGITDEGAELQSIRRDGTEFLWQGDPAFWASRASNLFPICGRLTDGKYTWRGKTYEMELHGFARHRTFAVTEQKEDSITFLLTDTEESRTIYPFAFRLFIRYSLEAGTLHCIYRVENPGEENLIFALGGHPGFLVPMGGEGTFEDSYLEFGCEKPVKKLLFRECYTTDDTQPLPGLRDGRFLDLKHSLFDDDAIFMKDMCKTVSLRSRASSHSVTLQYPGMNYLGIWHKPCCSAPYVCIEPWYSVPAYWNKVDDLATKRDMISLPADGAYETEISIAVE